METVDWSNNQHIIIGINMETVKQLDDEPEDLVDTTELDDDIQSSEKYIEWLQVKIDAEMYKLEQLKERKKSIEIKTPK